MPSGCHEPRECSQLATLKKTTRDSAEKLSFPKVFSDTWVRRCTRHCSVTLKKCRDIEKRLRVKGRGRASDIDKAQLKGAETQEEEAWKGEGKLNTGSALGSSWRERGRSIHQT